MARLYDENLIIESVYKYDSHIKLFDKITENNFTYLCFEIPKNLVSYDLFNWLHMSMVQYEIFMNVYHEIIVKIMVK